jgi:rRNA maturation endonuclease Nob1
MRCYNCKCNMITFKEDKYVCPLCGGAVEN